MGKREENEASQTKCWVRPCENCRLLIDKILCITTHPYRIFISQSQIKNISRCRRYAGKSGLNQSTKSVSAIKKNLIKNYQQAYIVSPFLAYSWNHFHLYFDRLTFITNTGQEYVRTIQFWLYGYFTWIFQCISLGRFSSFGILTAVLIVFVWSVCLSVSTHCCVNKDCQQRQILLQQ